MYRSPQIVERSPSAGFLEPGLTGLHPLLERVYRNRGIQLAEEIEHGLGNLLPPDSLDGTDQGAQLLYQVLQQQGHVLVLGDFDADGATSCALAVRGLRAMGFQRVSYLVPNRFQFGYGLTPEIVEVAVERSPDLIITVDNGIASLDGVKAAKALGCRVLITDHHLPGNELPEADVIINPNMPTDGFPSKNLAGVGVVFYLLAALRRLLIENQWFELNQITAPRLADYLDLVALGTVADLVPLDHNNRVLVHNGLQRIRSAACCPGIQALAAIGKRSLHRLVSADLGFVVGPRLNAAGRLDDMSLGIECLLTDDIAVAQRLALELDRLNSERKSIEAQMKQEAIRLMEQVNPEEADAVGICLFDQTWHQGVIGILAARVKERYHRPTIIFAPGEEAGTLKGSARSVPGLHIKDVLDQIAIQSPGMMDKFGGHAMAAGVSLQLENYSQFKQLFVSQVIKSLGHEQLIPKLETDGELKADELTLETAELLRKAAPWGQDFPEPLFEGVFLVTESRLVGEQHVKLSLTSNNAPSIALDAIAFNQSNRGLPAVGSELQVVYKLDVNEFRGTQKVQMMVEFYKAAGDSSTMSGV